MATTTSHDTQQQLLPPSPPPSPPTARLRHKKKKSDPFDELPITPIPSPPASPPNEPADPDLWTRIVVTPILFTSFLLSLFVVDYRNRARRTEEHTYRTTFLSYFSPSAWFDPEPYQDPDDSTWSREGPAGHVEPHDAISPGSAVDKNKKKSWFIRKKIRKVAKLEISDAFEMRTRVIMGMAAAIVFSAAAAWIGVKWAIASLSSSLHRFGTRT